MLLLFAGFQLEDIDDIGIGTAEAEVSVLACGQSAAIAQDIDIGKATCMAMGQSAPRSVSKSKESPIL